MANEQASTSSRPPRSRWRYQDPEYETRINAAIDGILSKKYKTYAEAARKENASHSSVTAEHVVYTTLIDRMKGRRRPEKTYRASRQSLAPEQEPVLVSWVIEQAEAGRPVSKSDLRAAAADMRGGAFVGKKWYRGFLKRNPTLKFAKASKLDPKRAQNFNKSNFNDFIKKWATEFDKYGGIPPEHVWNMDEKGIQMAGGRRNSQAKFLFRGSSKARYAIASDNLELVTVLECVSAAGATCPPCFVLSKGPMPSLELVENKTVGGIGVTENGWTSGKIAKDWLKDVFVPCALERRVDTSKPIVLVMDRHDSHDNLDFIALAYEVSENVGCDVLIMGLPSKCTHKLQPLDVGVLNHVQRLWSNEVYRCGQEGTPINRYTVVPAYVRARSKVEPDWIREAWKKTGLYPINRDIFTEEDFAPSRSSSTIAHVPGTMPDEIPTSPLAIPTDIDTDDVSDVDNDYNPDINSGEDSEGLDSDTSMDSQEDMVDCEDDDDDESMLEDSETPDKDDNGGRPFIPRLGPPLDDPIAPLNPEVPELVETPIRPLVPLHSTPASPTPNHAYRTRPSLATLASTPSPKSPVASAGSDLSTQVMDLQMRHRSLQIQSELQASEITSLKAHLTMVKRQLGCVQVKLDNAVKRKERGSSKIKGDWLTLPQNKAAFEALQAERQRENEAAAEKEKAKAAATTAQQAQIQADALSKVFDRPLLSYKKKDDLLALATAFQISTEGNIPTLVARLRQHLHDNPQLKDQARFSGLFQQPRQRQRPTQT